MSRRAVFLIRLAVLPTINTLAVALHSATKLRAAADRGVGGTRRGRSRRACRAPAWAAETRAQAQASIRGDKVTRPLRVLLGVLAAAKALRRPIAVSLLIAAAFSAAATEDHRAWQHGINLLKIDGRYLLIWSSWGNPPQPRLPGDWEHDIYYSWLDSERPTLEVQTLVSHAEAQEPASAAVTRNGRLLVTWEDGDGGIHQNAGLWDTSLRAIQPDWLRVRDGGHSGHVAALGERFLIAYSQDWVAGGAFLDRGTGKHLHARIVDAVGELGPEIDIAIGRNPDRHENWPLVAASDRNWLVVWQRYPERSLHGALVDADGRVTRRLRIAKRLSVGHEYDVQFAPGLDRFVVLGSTDRHGFVTLLDTAGNVVASAEHLPRAVGESQIVLASSAVEVTAVYPTAPSGVAVLRITRAGVQLAKHIEHSHVWDYTGTVGAFVTPERALFATLSKTGVKLVQIDGVAGD
jgi:hypothetical protein